MFVAMKWYNALTISSTCLFRSIDIVKTPLKISSHSVKYPSSNVAIRMIAENYVLIFVQEIGTHTTGIQKSNISKVVLL